MSHIIAGELAKQTGADKYLKYVPYALGTVAVGGVLVVGGLVAKKFLDWKPTIPGMDVPPWLQDLLGTGQELIGDDTTVGAAVIGKGDMDKLLQEAYDAAFEAMDVSIFWDAYYETEIMVSGLLATGPISIWWNLKKIAWKMRGDKLEKLIEVKRQEYEEQQADVYQEWADQRAADEARWREEQRLLQEAADKKIADMYKQYGDQRTADEERWARERGVLEMQMDLYVQQLQAYAGVVGPTPVAQPTPTTPETEFETYTGMTWQAFQDFYGNDEVDAFMHQVGVPVEASSKDYPRERLMAWNYFHGSEKGE